jgi:hypothetical protein
MRPAGTSAGVGRIGSTGEAPEQRGAIHGGGCGGSCSAKGNTEEAHTCRTQGREHVSQGLGGVREAARRIESRSSPHCCTTSTSICCGAAITR